MLFSEAASIVRATGYRLSRARWGGYRVNDPNGSEVTAHHTRTLADAVDAAQNMSGNISLDDIFPDMCQDVARSKRVAELLAQA